MISTDDEEFFQKFKRETEKRWSTAEVNKSVYGYQIQKGTKWKDGLRMDQVLSFEDILGCALPSTLRDFYSNMNGLDKPGVNVYGESGEPYSYIDIFYSLPDDIDRINDQLQWVFQEFQITRADLMKRNIPMIFPVCLHRFMLIDGVNNPILSMYGSDVIVYSSTLKHFLVKDFLLQDDDDNIDDVNVEFWIEPSGES